MINTTNIDGFVLSHVDLNDMTVVAGVMDTSPNVFSLGMSRQNASLLFLIASLYEDDDRDGLEVFIDNATDLDCLVVLD